MNAINVNGASVIVTLASTESELIEAKRVDDVAFGENQGISLQELGKIVKFGALILMRLKSNGSLIGQSQLLFQPIDELPFDFAHPRAYCYGTGLLPEFQGKGLGKILAEQQEIIARENGATSLLMTVRVENYQSLRLRIGMGFEVYAYKPNFYGPDVAKDSRLALRKDITVGKVPVLGKSSQSDEVFVPVDFDKPVDLVVHARISDLIKRGYLGSRINREGLFFERR